uniref:Uncharacterized protein n=1 Tax=Panagrellus redivivus TaxID=6233 RepID=A0A7E4UQ54_PANRE
MPSTRIVHLLPINAINSNLENLMPLIFEKCDTLATSNVPLNVPMQAQDSFQRGEYFDVSSIARTIIPFFTA